MELVDSLLRFCTSAAALLALASAYKARDELDDLHKEVERLSKELDEIDCGGDVGADGE